MIRFAHKMPSIVPMSFGDIDRLRSRRRPVPSATLDSAAQGPRVLRLQRVSEPDVDQRSCLSSRGVFDHSQSLAISTSHNFSLSRRREKVIAEPRAKLK